MGCCLEPHEVTHVVIRLVWIWIVFFVQFITIFGFSSVWINPFDLKLLLLGAARAISKRPAECQWWQLLKRLENKSSKMAAWVVCQHKKSIWTGCCLNWSPLSTLAPSDGVWKHDSLTPANQPLEVQISRRALNENKSSPGNLQLKSLVMVMSNRNCF